MVPRDEQCPQRGPALTHMNAKDTWVCEFCGQVTYSSSQMPRQIPAPPREKGDGDFSSLNSAQWHRAIIERTRYEHGDLTDWPNAVPLSDDEMATLGRMTDALIGLFRRVG